MNFEVEKSICQWSNDLDLKNRKILIIDKNATNRDRNHEFLAVEGDSHGEEVVLVTVRDWKLQSAAVVRTEKYNFKNRRFTEIE